MIGEKDESKSKKRKKLKTKMIKTFARFKEINSKCPARCQTSILSLKFSSVVCCQFETRRNLIWENFELKSHFGQKDQTTKSEVEAQTNIFIIF